VLETNIIVIHDQTPHISLPDPPFLLSRRHSRSHDVCLATPTSPLLLLLSLKVFLLQWRDDFFFVKEEKLPFFDSSREKKKRKDRRLLRQNNKRSLQKPLVLSLLSPVVRAPAVVRRNAALFPFS